jgi:UDP:flavonoid glycosyltransferase YjiC (YdhE family)
VPLLCVPLGRDQVDNATRVVVRGAGLMRKRGASVAAYRRVLERLLGDNDSPSRSICQNSLDVPSLSS